MQKVLEGSRKHPEELGAQTQGSGVDRVGWRQVFRPFVGDFAMTFRVPSKPVRRARILRLAS